MMFRFESKVLMKLVYIPCFYQDSLALPFVLLAQALALPLTVFEFQTSVPLFLLSFRVFCLFVCSKIPLLPADNDRMNNNTI